MKLNTSGVYQWHTFYGSANNDYAYSIAVDGSGNVYMTGSSGATWQGDGNTNPLHAYTGGASDIVVLKLSDPPPASVPTMNEWGMIIFMVFAGLAAAFYLRRQKTVKS